jgi:predicted RND superfamily exporter protein
VAKDLEAKIRERYQTEEITIHIIGFAKVIGDIAEGAARVVLFFLIAFLITAALVYIYTQSFKLTVIPLVCSIVAVIWQLGGLTLLGFGIDPMSILVPFLVFAIGVSHGVQMVSANGAEIFDGATSIEAARASFRKLLIPGSIALASDTIGFITILLIEIRVIQEMAITASLGVAVIILTNLILLPVLLSMNQFADNYRDKLKRRSQAMAPIWEKLSSVASRPVAVPLLILTVALFIFGYWYGKDVKIGDLHRGVPELRAESRYNMDTDMITDRFSIGVDIINIIVETVPDACIDYQIMRQVEDFGWYIRNVEGVQSVISMPIVAKLINAGWNEGSMKWRILPRNQSMMAQSVTYIPTGTGLLNANCSVMPVMVFTADHKAETIERIVDAVKAYDAEFGQEGLRFKLATGNVGVMAATNEAVAAAQFPMLMYVFAAIIILCTVTFRSLRATLCIVIPLALVSLLAYALMTFLEIGLKVSTLPVAALGVGIGVDYGIYIFSRFQTLLDEGHSIRKAFRETLTITGNGVVFTGVTLAIGVATWIFSPLKFQADMGILLTFMFLVNMLGAILLLPALATFLLSNKYKND